MAKRLRTGRGARGARSERRTMRNARSAHAALHVLDELARARRRGGVDAPNPSMADALRRSGVRGSPGA